MFRAAQSRATNAKWRVALTQNAQVLNTPIRTAIAHFGWVVLVALAPAAMFPQATNGRTESRVPQAPAERLQVQCMLRPHSLFF